MELMNVKYSITKKELELARLEEALKELPLYKEIEALRVEIASAKRKQEEQENELLEAMLRENVAEWDDGVYNIKIKNTARDSVKVLDIDEIPKEFIRTKIEADKVAIMKLYKETGVLTPGTDIVKDDKFKLEIKESKRKAS